MIKIAKISDDLYQIDDNELPVDVTELRQVVSSYGGLNDVDVSKKLDELDEKKEISLEKQANSAVVVDMYEVDYPTPQDPMKETQEIAKHLDEKNDFVTQFIFPSTETEDVVVDLHQNIKKNEPPKKFNWRILRETPYDKSVEKGWGMLKNNKVQKENVFKFGDTYYQFLQPIRANQLQVGEVYGASYYEFNSGYDLIRYKGLSYTSGATGPEVVSVKELLQHFNLRSLKTLYEADLYLNWKRPEVYQRIDDEQKAQVDEFFQKYPSLLELDEIPDVNMWGDYWDDSQNVWDENKDYYYLFEGRFARGSGAEKLTFWVAEEVSVPDVESSKKLNWAQIKKHKYIFITHVFAHYMGAHGESKNKITINAPTLFDAYCFREKVNPEEFAKEYGMDIQRAKESDEYFIKEMGDNFDNEEYTITIIKDGIAIFTPEGEENDEGEFEVESSKKLNWTNPVTKVWYAIVTGGARGLLWTKKVKMSFPEEDIDVIVAVLAQAGYFNTKDAAEEYSQYLETKDKEMDLFFWSEIQVGGTLAEISNNNWTAVGDEWYGGFGDTPEGAMNAYLVAKNELESGNNTDEWDEDNTFASKKLNWRSYYKEGNPDDFFKVDNCDRCKNKLNARIMSWFNNDTICMECAEKEKQYMKEHPKAYDMEGKGLPDELKTLGSKLSWNLSPSYKTPIHLDKSSHKILEKLYTAPNHTLRARDLFTINPGNTPDGHWLTFLLYRGYVDRPERGFYVLTEKGIAAAERLRERKNLQWQTGIPEENEFKRGQRIRIREGSPEDHRTFSLEDDSEYEGEDFTIPVGSIGIVSEDTTEEWDDVSVIFPTYKEKLGTVPCIVYKQDIELVE